MKQIDNTQKKAYEKPQMDVIESESADILAGSPPPPHDYDGELGVKKNQFLYDNDEQD